jgi:hypothetical protein
MNQFDEPFRKQKTHLLAFGDGFFIQENLDYICSEMTLSARRIAFTLFIRFLTEGFVK